MKNGLSGSFKGTVQAMGLVFGDIGTSPIYTITVIFLTLEATLSNILGVLSLIIWTMVALVAVEYAWLAMSLSKRGEGGDIVLREILISNLKNKKAIAAVIFISFIMISLVIGDGVITPAISILSAVEGSRLIPGIENISQATLLLVASLIAILLFSFQRKGAGKVSGTFGPIMLVWFLSLFLSGLLSIIKTPEVLKAIYPYFALEFLLSHRAKGFFVLSEVILCATGGEALYADMGHLGRKPIIQAWKLVFPALVINYLGQGAYLLRNPETTNVLYSLILSISRYIYVPFLLLSILATVIASQAMISGVFSIIYQAMTTRTLPMMKVEYTSKELNTQIYISSINWFLLFAVLFIMLQFQESANLAAAYGLAVTGTMTLAGTLMTWIFYLKKKYFKMWIAFIVTIIDAVYLIANTYKIPHGGYWSLIIAAIPFTFILVYTRGAARHYRMLKPTPLKEFLDRFKAAYTSEPKINGTALYFVRDFSSVSPYIIQTMFVNNILYQDNILVSVSRTEEPFGVEWRFRDDLDMPEGLRAFEIRMGYMEVVNIGIIFKEASIDEKAIFYGVEDIVTNNPVWKLYSLIRKLTPSYVQFFSLPSDKLHGVITRVEM